MISKEKIHEHYPDFIINNETKITCKEQPLDLTVEEYLILTAIIRHPVRVFTQEQITAIVGEDILFNVFGHRAVIWAYNTS